MEILGRLWSAWKRVGQVIGDFIARLFLTLFYFTVFLPFGLAVRLFADPLGLKPSATRWQPRTDDAADLSDARRLS